MDFDSQHQKWFCCCCHLTRGLVILSSAEIILSLFLLLYTIAYIALSNSNEQHDNMLWFMIILMSISIMFGVTSALLIFGINKYKVKLMYPTLVARAIIVFFMQAFGVSIIVRPSHTIDVINLNESNDEIMHKNFVQEKMRIKMVPNLPALNISYDGRVEWNPTKSMDATIHQFRSAVLGANVRIIKQILKDLHNLAPGQIERLIALLINRTSVEPTKEALMTAICIGSRPLVEFILSLFMEYPGEERNGCRKSKSFPVHMTPLMLACICNNFAIVQCLLLRKHYMQLPHRPDCHCDECLRSAHCMENSIILLDTYRAISSESFLWLACTDPLLAAFNLAVDLQVCEEMEKEHKVAYRNLRHNVMTFAVKIAEQCWTTEEIHVLLSRKVGSPLADCELRFPRIQLALKTHMKPFLSLLGIQATIEGHWHGMWTDSGKFKCQDLSRKFRHFICYPILALLHAISAGSCIETFKYPLARYMSRLASYILFLTILIFIRYFGRTGEQSSERSLVNSNLRLILESYVYLYVYGMAVIHYIEFASKGFMTFYNVWWRWFDLILIWLFSGSFFCFIMTAATIHQDGLKQLHRRHWVYYDFSIIYDIYFGTASIMALWRLLYYFQLQRNIGSTVVALIN
ncbi:Transient receptor ion channel II family protein [Brugia pahangi]